MRELALKSHAVSKKHQSRSPTEPNNSLSFFDRGKSFIQMCTDGPKVKSESKEVPPLMQIGTCGLHTIHGSMKAGVKKSN